MTHYLLDNGHNINCLGVDNITFYFILYLPWSRHQRCTRRTLTRVSKVNVWGTVWAMGSLLGVW